MNDWPELASEAHKCACKNHYLSEVLARLEANSLNLKPLFIKIDNIFDETISTPGALDRQNNFLETDQEIKRRFWLQFFESLGFAVQRHSLKSEERISQNRRDYIGLLKTAINQANNLAESLESLAQYDKAEMGFDYDGDEYQPLEWIINAIKEEGKDFCNPVFDELENLHRYGNGRYWPSADNVIYYGLACALMNSLAACDINFKTKAPAIIESLEENNWCLDSKYSWHLPSHFMNRLSDSELSLLISTALGLNNIKNRSTIRRARGMVDMLKHN